MMRRKEKRMDEVGEEIGVGEYGRDGGEGGGRGERGHEMRGIK